MINFPRIPTISPITAKRIPITAILFLFVAPLVVVYYASFVFNPENMGNAILYVFQVVADIIAMSVMLSLWVTIFMDVFVANHHRIHIQNKEHFMERKPTVDVFVTAAGEPEEIIEKTVRAAVEMDYAHNTFLLDDGQSAYLKELTSKLGVHYITRTNRLFAKSGNLNNGLRYSSAEFFIIFDADQVPKKEFITKLLPYMAKEDFGMVQSPQHFHNTHQFIAMGTAQAQDVFYQYLCPAKNISNSAFCVGTNVLFRRKAIDDIGGVAQVGHSEDIWTSRLLHEKKWKTIFVNEVLASGIAPATIAAFFKQQLRWSKGGLSMMFLRNPMGSRELSLDQRVQYFTANMFYLVGFSILIYISFPLLYLLFGISPLDAQSSANWIAHYAPYFLLYYSLSWLLLGKIEMATISTSIASFWPYVLAFFSIVFNTKLTWTATTSRKKSGQVIMGWIWPHVFIIIMTLLALIVGWFEPRNFWDTLISSIWAVWNMYLLVLFITGEKRLIGQRTV
jgi:cellulose synthase (UDP-forming)